MEDAIRLLDGRQSGLESPADFGDILETGTLELQNAEREEVSGAGYGDRTRLTGLGSQDITTMLSPPAEEDRSTATTG